MENSTYLEALPSLEQVTGRLTSNAHAMLEGIFAQKQISTIEIIRLLPRDKKGGLRFTTTLSSLTKIFGQYGVAVTYVTQRKVSFKELDVKIGNANAVPLESIASKTIIARTKTQVKHRQIPKANESVDFNELEKYVRIEIERSPKENSDFLFPEIDWYAETVKHHKILAKDVIYKLIEEAQQGNVHSQNMIIMHNQKLLLQLGGKYKSRLGFKPHGIELEDILQEGNFGIKRAIELFDPSLGFSFSTYAYRWIEQSMGRAMADFGHTVRFPVHVHEKLSKFRKLFALMEARGAEKPNFAEIAARMEIKTHEVFDLEQLEHFKNGISLDEPGKDDDDGEGSGIGDFLGDTRDITPTQMVDRKILKEKIRRCMKINLSIKEYQIIDKRYGLSNNRYMTLNEIGDEFGVTRERIRQIEAIALAKVKNDAALRKFAEEYLERQFAETEVTEKTQLAGSDQVIKAATNQSLIPRTIGVVGKFYGISEESICSDNRKEDVVLARHVAMYILRGHFKLSLSEIARKFNERDHTTVRHAYFKIEKDARETKGLSGDIQFLIELLNSYSEIAS